MDRFNPVSDVAKRTELAIVTGAASGVGLATVHRLRSTGSRVIGIDLQPSPETFRVDRNVAWVAGDASSPATWETALSLAETEFAAFPDVLVLNAGRLALGNVLETSVDTFREVMEVNVYGAVLGMQACLPHMIRAGSGTVVVVASVNGLFAEQNLAAYNTSKGALVQLVRSTAVDHARSGVRINAVCPTSIDTPFLRRHVDSTPDPEAFWRAMAARHPTGSVLTPDQVASAVLFLASDQSTGITGTTLVIDCGLTASPTYDDTL